MPPRTTRKSYRLRASDRTMVGTFCNRTACRIRNRRRRHDSNMNLRKKRTPRASQHYVGWRARQKSLLLPVAGEVFLLTLPFIERPYRKSALGATRYEPRLVQSPVRLPHLSSTALVIGSDSLSMRGETMQRRGWKQRELH